MDYSCSKQRWLAVSLSAFVASAAACGDEGVQRAPELVGTWKAESISAQGTNESCPAEIDLTPTSSVGCGTESWTFNADGTIVVVQTTDEAGDPEPWRVEGTWFTQGNVLTVTLRQQGPDASNLQPIEPPETSSGTWSISGTTVTVVTVDDGVTVTGTFEKQ